jgi:hypothetical protein
MEVEIKKWEQHEKKQGRCTSVTSHTFASCLSRQVEWNLVMVVGFCFYNWNRDLLDTKVRLPLIWGWNQNYLFLLGRQFNDSFERASINSGSELASARPSHLPLKGSDQQWSDLSSRSTGGPTSKHVKVFKREIWSWVPARLDTKNYCAGEGQQQLKRNPTLYSVGWYVHWWMMN